MIGLVKGRMQDAAACRDRGIGWTGLFHKGEADHVRVTFSARTNPADLARWFCEPAAPGSGAGFPAGTLLWYQ